MALFSVVDGLPAGGLALGAAYAEKFGAPRPGHEICLRRVPLSATGFRG